MGLSALRFIAGHTKGQTSQRATPRDVYFAPASLSASAILHESLHVFFGANPNDPDLAIGAAPEENGLGFGTFTQQQLFDPGLNTRLATTHLQKLINSFDGDVRKALGAYKQGESGVREDGMTQKTKEYADGILGCERAMQTGRS